MKTQFRVEALGTIWMFKLEGEGAASLESIVANAVSDFEQKYSRFDKDSLVSILNDTRQLLSPDPEFVAMLNFACSLYSETSGVFDISVGGELEQAGYGASAGSGRSSNLLKDIMFEDDSVRLSGSARIDFGGFGKGWLVDILADLLKGQGLDGFVINAGGDIYVHGSENLAIVDPSDQGRYIGVVEVHKGSLCASSNSVRRWARGGVEKTHIPDASSSLASSHVLHPETKVADALATCALMMDRQPFQELCRRYNAEYMLVMSGEPARVFRSKSFNFKKN